MIRCLSDQLNHFVGQWSPAFLFAQPPAVHFGPEQEECPHCRKPLKALKTKGRGVVTLHIGRFNAQETIRICDRCRRTSFSKHRREDVQPIPLPLAKVLPVHFNGMQPTDKAFNVPPNYDTADMLRADLSDARTAWIDVAKGDKEEHDRREQSAFLRYADDAERVAD